MKYWPVLFLLLFSLPSLAQSQRPPAKRIYIKPAQVIDITQARKKPENLFDGDTTTPALPDFYNGFILNETKGQVAWIVLDSFINHPKIEIFNTRWASGGQVDFQFFYDWTDTGRHSPVYSTTLPSAQWKWVDSAGTRAWRDSARLVKLRIADGGSNNFMEVRLYANKLGPARAIYPDAAPEPPDEGKYFMGYGKIFTDTMMDDAGYSQRVQSDMAYIDTARASNGKSIVLNKFNNIVTVNFIPARKGGRKAFPYLAGPRHAFKYPPHFNNDSKDMPIGADSTDIKSWQAVYNTYHGLSAKLGHNKKAIIDDYHFRNSDPGVGLGMIEEIEIGNEDDARWAGPLRFHSPLVKMLKLKQGYDGAKAADPNIKVISGALTGIDTSYLKAMYFTNLLRFGTKKMPLDVIAINEYATNAGGQHGPTSDGVSPEQFKLYEKLKALISFRNRYYPGKPIYLTEFGYDVHNGSNYEVPDIPGQTREQTKAYWMIRSMEITAAARVSKYFQYTQRNIPGGDFSTTGFSYDTLLKVPGKQLPEYLHQVMTPNVLQNGGWTSLPKDLYWYMTMRARVLENYKAWPTIVRRGDSSGIWIMKYAHRTDPNTSVYSVWLGSRKNASVKNYMLKTGVIQSASIVRAAIGKKQGVRLPAEKSGDAVRIPVVDESVTYIIVQSK
jgi:hypothetical protein